MDFESSTGVVWCIKITQSFCVNIYAEEFDNNIMKIDTGQVGMCVTFTDRDRRENSISCDGSCFDKREAIQCRYIELLKYS